ncbi:XRE family transcriptional regulator [Thalassolituus sp. HI0120]|jgi:transcriptional regulator with XRE-family HTH domain|nr:XRE family transcriptional regulator [Thalassolituus sp. HI0120]
MVESPLQTLGQHLQQLRLAQGISLSQLAADAGIAKSNLSKIEQGKSNPTLDTMWRIALQLKVPFGNLVAPIDLTVGDDDFQVRLLDQGRESPNVDAYTMNCAANKQHNSAPHLPGTTETITMIRGQLEVGTNDDSVCLTAGQSYTFSAQQPHFYRSGDQGASCLMIVVYNDQEAS